MVIINMTVEWLTEVHESHAMLLHSSSNLPTLEKCNCINGISPCLGLAGASVVEGVAGTAGVKL
jgi:hypothetical protein